MHQQLRPVLTVRDADSYRLAVLPGRRARQCRWYQDCDCSFCPLQASLLAAQSSEADSFHNRQLGPKRPCVNIAEIPINNLTMREAIHAMEAMIRERVPRYVVTPNIDHIVRLRSDKQFRRAYQGASLILADGMPILWASRFLGRRLMEKVSGSDLFPAFCRTAAAKGYRLYFLGGLPGAVEGTAEILTRRYPGLRVVGVHCPPLGFEKDSSENQRTIELIREAAPDALFVGLGTPKAEIWIHRYHRQYNVPVSASIGASFDFVTGLVRRAPVILQRLGLEWLWRLIMEPRRLYRRYLIDDPAFFTMVWEQKKLARRLKRREVEWSL